MILKTIHTMNSIITLTKRNYSTKPVNLPTTYSDKFGNTIHNANHKPVDIKKLVKNTTKGKAVLLHNIHKNLINEYNDSIAGPSKMCAKLQLSNEHYGDDRNTYLIRNGSNCPELFYNQYFAGGVNIIVKYLDQYYTLLVKDKTKNYLTVPGGTANSSDFEYQISSNYDEESDIDIHRTGYNIAVRELLEETRGMTDDGTALDGLKYEYLDLSKNCRFHFKSTFFDVPDINDIYIMHRAYIDLDTQEDNSVKTYLSKLFSPEHQSNYETIYTAYTMKYKNHNETEYVHAARLFPITSGPSIFDKYKLYDRHYGQNQHPVTNLHLGASHMSLFKILNSKLAINYPKNLVKLHEYN